MIRSLGDRHLVILVRRKINKQLGEDKDKDEEEEERDKEEEGEQQRDLEQKVIFRLRTLQSSLSSSSLTSTSRSARRAESTAVGNAATKTWGARRRAAARKALDGIFLSFLW